MFTNDNPYQSPQAHDVGEVRRPLHTLTPHPSRGVSLAVAGTFAVPGLALIGFALADFRRSSFDIGAEIACGAMGLALLFVAWTVYVNTRDDER